MSPGGNSIVIDDHHVHEPDALVRCGESSESSLVEIPDPLIVVEVLSPSDSGRCDISDRFASIDIVESSSPYLYGLGRIRPFLVPARGSAARLRPPASPN